MTEKVNLYSLCGNQNSKLFDRREFRGQEVNNRRCLNCGRVYQSPWVIRGKSGDFHMQKYRSLYEGCYQPNTHNLTDQRGRVESLIMFSRPSLSTIRKHLDIGCSVSRLLQLFQEAYHCWSVGIEPDKEHRLHAQKDGLVVYAKLNELEKSRQDRFDLVSMVHILEHLLDSAIYIAYLRERILTPDRWLLVKLPNLYAHDCFEIAHLVSCSSYTLKQVLEKAGFEIEKLDKNVSPRSQFLPFNISILARPAPAFHRRFPLPPKNEYHACAVPECSDSASWNSSGRAKRGYLHPNSF